MRSFFLLTCNWRKAAKKTFVRKRCKLNVDEIATCWAKVEIIDNYRLEIFVDVNSVDDDLRHSKGDYVSLVTGYPFIFARSDK